jgi:WD40 repeat protein
LREPTPQVLSLSLGLGGTLLATAAGNGAHFFDVRTAAKLGAYADNHTDVVTQVCFNPRNETELATGSEDGLVCLYDTRQAHADASLQVCSRCVLLAVVVVV